MKFAYMYLTFLFSDKDIIWNYKGKKNET